MLQKSKKLDWSNLSKKNYKTRVKTIQTLCKQDAQELCTCVTEFVKQKKRIYRLEPELQGRLRSSLHPHREQLSQFLKKCGKGKVKDMQNGGFLGTLAAILIPLITQLIIKAVKK